MSSEAARSSRISGFRKYSVSQRRSETAEVSGLTADRFETWDPESGLSLEQADRMIENTVGVLGTPIGIATNFLVDGRDVLVPMATEEPSVVAAASNLARMTRENGGFATSQTDPLMQAQIQLLDVVDPEAARLRLLEAADEISTLADSQDPRLVEVGGGVREVIVRLVPSRRQTYVVVHLVVDVRDAMGANAVNTMAEAVAPRLGEIAGGHPLLRILTNKADRRLTRVRGVFDAALLGGGEVVESMLDAAELAVADPYRAATHNKGIMNGITAVVLATGNDTRAVEAGAHSYAASGGQYSAMSQYEVDREGNLVGTMELPMPVGLVGGATSVHPAAKTAVSVLGVTTAADLGSVIMAVGLAQNAAALRALATEGIQRGHMSLHARNVAVTAGAQPHEVDRIVELLVSDGAVRVEHAADLLKELRA
ncbi:hydroxymethylglutaryl-CoA reductase, degradative [Brevibacterium sp. FAM 24638]|uniref:hydroxymethylglutaryl-CoA reductase, degradative n=1 Tax=Brevibacterium sp. FAM 24638 TaxID=3415681 RepID=UPI003C7DBBAE